MLHLNGLIEINYNQLEEATCLIISEIDNVYKYLNNHKTDEIIAKKLELLISSGVFKGIKIKVKFNLDSYLNVNIGDVVKLVFDKERSSIYVDNYKRIQLSFWIEKMEVLNNAYSA